MEALPYLAILDVTFMVTACNLFDHADLEICAVKIQTWARWYIYCAPMFPHKRKIKCIALEMYLTKTEGIILLWLET